MVQTAWSQALNGNLTSDNLSYNPEGDHIPGNVPSNFTTQSMGFSDAARSSSSFPDTDH